MNKNVSAAFLPVVLLSFCSCSSSNDEQLSRYSSYYHQLPNDHPARFVVNQTADYGPSPSYRLRYRMNEDGKLEYARRTVMKRVKQIEQAKRWKYSRMELQLPFGEKGIDFFGEYQLNTDIQESKKSRWNLHFDKQAVYAEFSCQDNYRIVNDRFPHDGDSLEIFICTDYTSKIYREIIVNPNGTIFTAIHANNRFGSFTTLVPNEAGKHGITAVVKDRNDGYCIQVRIPWRDLPEYTKGNEPKAGEDFYFMFVRTNKEGKKDPIKYTTPIPFLFGGHNVFGLIHVKIIPQNKKRI